MLVNFKLCITLCALLACITVSNGKRNKPPKSKGQAAQAQVTTDQPSAGDFGINLESHPYDSSANVNNTLLYLYPNSKPVILSVPAQYLKCDFETSCCWRNARPPADKMEWNLAKGQIPSILFEKYLGTPKTPEGRFLVVGSERENPPEEQALFISCTLECTEEPIKVSLKHWQRGLKLEVCSQDSTKKDGESENCQELPQDDTPGPTEITLPASPHANIVFKVSHLTALSLAIIDDIVVKSTPCPAPTTTPLPTTTSTTTTTTTTTPMPETGPNYSDAICPAVLCNFEEGNSCNFYNSPNGGPKAKKWKVVKGTFENRLTGVLSPGAGDSYLATYLKPNDVATLESKADFPDDRVVKFMVYKGTDKIDLKGCCDSVKNCPYISQGFAANDYKTWKSGSFTCTKGTKKVIFQANNNGKNEGAIGLDNTHLLLPSGGSSDDAHEKACLQ